MSELMQQLEHYLDAVSAGARVHAQTRPSQFKYACYEDLVRQRGRAWTSAQLPHGIRAGAMGFCYHNTLQLVARASGLLTYVEGYALPSFGDGEAGIPVQHAWAVDPFGNVLDNTWPYPHESAYYGITFERWEVARFIEISEDTFGILPTEYLLDFPLLRSGQLFPEEDAPHASRTRATRL